MNFLDFIIHPVFEGPLATIRIVFILVALILLVLYIYFLLNTSWIKFRLTQNASEFFNYKAAEAQKSGKQWTRVNKRLNSGLESEYKLAVIEADSMLDDILQRMGYKGETLGDRLKSVPQDIVPDINAVWEAHKVRNNIVHDPDYKLALDTVKKTLATYEKTFVELGVI